MVGGVNVWSAGWNMKMGGCLRVQVWRWLSDTDHVPARVAAVVADGNVDVPEWEDCFLCLSPIESVGVRGSLAWL